MCYVVTQGRLGELMCRAAPEPRLRAGAQAPGGSSSGAAHLDLLKNEQRNSWRLRLASLMQGAPEGREVAIVTSVSPGGRCIG